MNNLNWDNWESDLKKSVAEREQFFKGQSHKYFKREGTPGHYKYYYTEQEWKEAHGDKVKDKKKKTSLSDGEKVSLREQLFKLRDSLRFDYGEEKVKNQKEVRKINSVLKKNAPKLEPGKTYSVEDFSDNLAWSGGKVDGPEEKFRKDKYRVSDDDINNLRDILGHNNPGIYNYLNRNYPPTDIKVTKVRTETEKVDSPNIYDKMSAKSISYYEGSFKVKLSYNDEPMTIKTNFSKDTTLSQSDIRNFM